jgi:tRNA-uridine 2-sulfurtransferase
VNVLVAMSGGVDSSVAAALLLEEGHRVTGVTMKLWGGESDTGCCSASDVEDARRVAAQLGIRHYVFDFGDDFTRHVVDPYVDAYSAGRTPNPCVECNHHIKWGRLLQRADALGYDAVATGHHARVVATVAGPRLRRGRDAAKDQSYVLARTPERAIGRTLLPVGDLTKQEVRARADALGLRTASKPDSMDVCFITRGDRVAFVDRRRAAVAGAVVEVDGTRLARHDGVRRFTVGQRRGLGVATGRPRFVTDIDAATATVTLGSRADLLRDNVPLTDLAFVGARPPAGERLEIQTSAHGRPVGARLVDDALALEEPRPRVAPGQLVALYDDDVVIGAATAA